MNSEPLAYVIEFEDKGIDPFYAGIHEGAAGFAPTFFTAQLFETEEAATRTLKNAYGKSLSTVATIKPVFFGISVMSIEFLNAEDSTVEHHNGSYIQGCEEPVAGHGLLIRQFEDDGIVLQGDKRQIMAFLTRCMDALEDEPLMLDEDGNESNQEKLQAEHQNAFHNDNAEVHCMFCQMTELRFGDAK